MQCKKFGTKWILFIKMNQGIDSKIINKLVFNPHNAQDRFTY